MGNSINDKFIANLKNMNFIVKSEIKSGKKWKYKNSNQEHTFDEARKKNNRVVNCVLGARWGLRGLVPDGALAWWGNKGKIQWSNDKAKERAKKYFDIIKVGNKTVNQLYKQNLLCEGDILTYMSMVHTNVYIGNGKSFDTGHAYCLGQTFRKWIGALSCKRYKVNYIFRLKDRTRYIVQGGAFYDKSKADERVALLKRCGLLPIIKEKDSMYKIQLGCFDGKENAEAYAAKVNNNKELKKLVGGTINAFVAEA